MSAYLDTVGYYVKTCARRVPGVLHVIKFVTVAAETATILMANARAPLEQFALITAQLVRTELSSFEFAKRVTFFFKEFCRFFLKTFWKKCRITTLNL